MFVKPWDMAAGIVRYAIWPCVKRKRFITRQRGGKGRDALQRIAKSVGRV